MKKVGFNKKLKSVIFKVFGLPLPKEDFFGTYHFLSKSEQAHWVMYKNNFISYGELLNSLYPTTI